MTEPLQPPHPPWVKATIRDYTETTFEQVHDLHVQAVLDALSSRLVRPTDAVVMLDSMIALAEIEGYRR